MDRQHSGIFHGLKCWLESVVGMVVVVPTLVAQEITPTGLNTGGGKVAVARDR